MSCVGGSEAWWSHVRNETVANNPKYSNHDTLNHFDLKNNLNLLDCDVLLQSRFCCLWSPGSLWRNDGRISCCVWQSCVVEKRPSQTFLLLLLLHLHLCLRPLCPQECSKQGPGLLARSVARCPPSQLPAAGPPTTSPQSTAWLRSSRSCRWTRRDHHGNWVTGEGERNLLLF